MSPASRKWIVRDIKERDNLQLQFADPVAFRCVSIFRPCPPIHLLLIFITFLGSSRRNGECWCFTWISDEKINEYFWVSVYIPLFGKFLLHRFNLIMYWIFELVNDYMYLVVGLYHIHTISTIIKLINAKEHTTLEMVCFPYTNRFLGICQQLAEASLITFTRNVWINIYPPEWHDLRWYQYYIN